MALNIKTIALLFSLSAMIGFLSPARAELTEMADDVQSALVRALSPRMSGARIEITSPVRWTRGGAPEEEGTVSILNTTARGEAQFVIRAKSGMTTGEGWVNYRAFVPARIAVRKLLPGEKLRADSVTVQEVDIASGAAYDYRGVILPVEGALDHFETRQTFLEGQLLTSSGIQKVPDIRRGDPVRIRILSGGIAVSTVGSAEEPAYLNGRIRVTSVKSKREFVGVLESSGVVEVKL